MHLIQWYTAYQYEYANLLNGYNAPYIYNAKCHHHHHHCSAPNDSCLFLAEFEQDFFLSFSEEALE